MKIICATWEKRNLGVDAMEFEFSPDEDLVKAEKALREAEADYNVVKIPNLSVGAYEMMSKLGYSYTESSIGVEHALKEIHLTSIQRRIAEQINYSLMAEDDIEEMFAEIQKGMFTKDRIALNRHFGETIANKRYENWIRDELEAKNEVYKMMYKGKNYGFFTYKETNSGIFVSLLGGLYSAFRMSGLGFSGSYFEILEARRRNGKKVRTHISSNNLNSLNLHMSLGYTVYEMSAVFSKTNT